MKKLIILVSLFCHFSLLAHSTTMEPLQVLGHRQEENLVDFVPSVTKITDKDLQKKRQTSLADTIQNEPGVTSTNFGPSASRPVIRGLDGDRIRVLQNSLGTMDASTQSLDHTIPIDPLTIDQIEIVRGPMSLLYGSSAVGGVVNIVTNRTKSTFEEGFSTRLLSQAESVNHGLSNALSADYGKNKWMVHADVSTRNLGHQRIPGYARSEKKRQTTALTSTQAEGNKILPNSFNKQQNQAIGVSKILDKGSLGISFNHFETNYGTVAEQTVAINMIQNRYELDFNYQSPLPIFKKIKLKSAHSEYNHREKNNGAIGTTFKNNGNESRLEAINSNENLEGVLGIQTQIFKFGATGTEAFLPDTKNNKGALFAFQEYKKEKEIYSAGVRFEATELNKLSSTNFGAKDNQSFSSYNGSLGYLYKLRSFDSLSLNTSYTERAPNFQELYSAGPHIATGNYEQGSVILRKEKTYAAELSYKYKQIKNQFNLNLYAQKFDGFIALSPTGLTDSASTLPIYKYNQMAAQFCGTDLENKNELTKTQSGSLWFVTKADMVVGKESSTKNYLPRLTPPRLILGLEYGLDSWNIDLEAVNTMRQTKVAPNETQTQSYTLTNAGYTYNFIGEKHSISTFFRVRNIFDQEARNHVSTLKDISPMPGRNAILGIQMSI